MLSWMWLQNTCWTRYRLMSKYWGKLKNYIVVLSSVHLLISTVKKNKDNFTSVLLFWFRLFFFTDTILFTIFSFSQGLFYRFLISNITNFFFSMSCPSLDCDQQWRWYSLMLMLFCNIYVMYFSLMCWISLLIMTSDVYWRLNRKECYM